MSHPAKRSSAVYEASILNELLFLKLTGGHSTYYTVAYNMYKAADSPFDL